MNNNMEKIDDLRKFDIDKLKALLTEVNSKLMDSKLNRLSGKEKDTTMFVKSRKYIARINTLIKEKEILQ